MVELFPTSDEIERWIKEVVKHSNHVEYYLNGLGIGDNDPERPHDLVGIGNKLELEVVKGLSLTYRKMDERLFEKYILPSIEFHRNQYHHQRWNRFNPEATIEDLYVGVVDAVCTLLENRTYSGGKEQEELGKKYYWSSVEKKMFEENPKHRVSAAKIIVPRMREIVRPKLGVIEDVFDFPNIGIRDDVYDLMRMRIDDAVSDLRKQIDIF
jgi:hypothetical protein